MIEDLVSVIIPVYNVERYLSQCLESICNQTYQKMEIIVVDDESPDNCGKIEDEYASRDKRIRVLHIQNRGAAGARNVGLDICRGEYVMFVDSDDWLEKNAIKKLLVTLKETKSDIAMCQYMDEYTDSTKPHIYIEKNDISTNEQFLKGMIPHWEYILIWNKIYKSSLLKDIRFVEGRCIDDEFFMYQVMLKAQQIAYVTDCMYHYRQRQSGAMRNVAKVKQRLIDQADFITWRYRRIVDAFPNLKAEFLEHMMEVLMSVMRHGATYQDIYGYAKKKLWKYGMQALMRSDIQTITKKSILFYLIKRRSSFIVHVSSEETQQNYFE